MKYQGSCHCKAVQFEFQCETIESGLQCNCSICIRKNAIMSEQYIGPDQFKLLQGQEKLSVYLWGDKDVNHYFCQHCGIYPFHDSTHQKGRYRINLGCVDGLEPSSLNVIQFDGKHEL